MKIDIHYCVQWNYEPRALSLREELNNHYEGTFDNFEINIIESSGGAFEVFVNDNLKVFSKLNIGRFPNSTYEITKTIDDSIQEGRLR